jgi:hypothetical protein
MGFSLGAQSARHRVSVARRPHRDPARPARRGQLRSVSPCAVGRPCRTAIPVLSSRTTRRARTGRLHRPRRPAYATAAVPWPCHCPCRGLLPWRARSPPNRLELSYKSWPQSFTGGCTTLPRRHCRCLGAHSEPLALAACTAITCCPYLPQDSPQLFPSLVAPAKPPARRRNRSRGGRRLTPLPMPSGHLSAATKHLNRFPTVPRPSPAAPPAIPAAGLAGIRRAAPPQAPTATLRGPRNIQGVLCKPRADL